MPFSYMVEVYFEMVRSMAETLDPGTISVIKASAPALAVHGAEIVRQMYAELFEQQSIRDLFNQSHQQGSESQVQALALVDEI
jgi:nitric oxide dioxygenase